MKWKVEVRNTQKHVVVKTFIYHFKNKEEAEKLAKMARRVGYEADVEEVE